MIATDPSSRVEGVPTGKAPARGGRLAVLDGLRFLAVLLVVVYHYVAYGSEWGRPRTEAFPGLYVPAAYGWLGVQLFFLISGFVICLSCWGRSLSDFLTSRIVRLFPAYWFAVLATTLLVGLIPGSTKPRPLKDVLTNLTMMEYPFGAPYVDGVYWSLWVEARFYLIFAVVVWLGVSYRRVLAFCLLWSAAGVLAYALPTVQLLQTLVMPEYCWFFIGGMAFHLMRRFGPDLLLWLLIAFSFAAGCRAVQPTYHFVAANASVDLPDWGVTAVLAVFYLLMAGVALDWFHRIDWRWLSTAGAVTYPLYLLHEYIGWQAIESLRYDVNPWVLAGSLLVVMIAASWAVQRFVERPVSRWMKGHLRRSFARLAALDGSAGGAMPGQRTSAAPDAAPRDAASGVGARR